jgi:four helix bundle protein
LEESLYWLELLEGAKIFPSDKLKDLENETSELTAILVSLIRRFRPKRC